MGGGFGAPAPSTSPLGGVALIVAICTGLLALWSLRRNARLARALCDLAEKTGQPVPEFRRRWFPRFGLKSLLVVTTVVALILGTVVGESLRAQRQDKALADVEAAAAHYVLAAHYESGWLGDGAIAEQFRHWVYSGFGYKVTQLTLHDDSYDKEAAGPSPAPDELARVLALTDLEALQLAGHIVSVEQMQAIGSLRHLRRLSFVECRLPTDALTLLRRPQQLAELELRQCGLIDRDLVGLERMTSLTRLSLASNRLTDGSLATLGKLARIRDLDLSDNDITGTGLDSLENHPQLQRICLEQLAMEPDVLAPLSRIESLRSLGLWGTQSRSKGVSLFRTQVESLWGNDSDVNLYWYPITDHNLWQIDDNRPMYGYTGGFGGAGGGAF
jgi:hypothetical protein